MNKDYHIHTKLCLHSDLSLEMIIKSYIKHKFIEIGFSDHIAYPKPWDQIDQARMAYDQVPLYLAKIKQAKQKYVGQISIKTGFESEYFTKMNYWYRQLLHDPQVDYLILGVHAAPNFKTKNNFNHHCKTKKHLKNYGKAFVKGMASNYFIYAAHPDFYMKSYPQWDKYCLKLAEKICDLALKLDFPLGFNINGLWKKPRQIGNQMRHKYPVKEFWDVVRAKGVKIILESDVHHQKQLEDQEIIKKAKALLKAWKIDHLIVQNLNFTKYYQQLNLTK